ncbi:MAG: hypothetical protein K6C08_12710 [Oscillospiraceae bacterium]|nr:hypothetical protein [Oscillospiraceae bacterium]
MFAVIKKPDPVTVLRICHSGETAVIAARLENNSVSPPEMTNITAVALDDVGYEETFF